MSLSAALLILAVWLLGCDKPSLESQIVGQWKGELNIADPGQAPNSFQQPPEHFEPTLNLKEDKTFDMTVAVMPIQGKWKLTGRTVSLEVTKVAGQTKEEFKKGAQKQIAALPFMPPVDWKQVDRPLSFEVSKDVRTLTSGDLAKTFSFLGPMAPSGVIVFKRLGAPEP